MRMRIDISAHRLIHVALEGVRFGFEIELSLWRRAAIGLLLQPKVVLLEPIWSD